MRQNHHDVVLAEGQHWLCLVCDVNEKKEKENRRKERKELFLLQLLKLLDCRSWLMTARVEELGVGPDS